MPQKNMPKLRVLPSAKAYCHSGTETRNLILYFSVLPCFFGHHCCLHGKQIFIFGQKYSHRNTEFNFVFSLCFRASVAITLVCKANNSYPVASNKNPLVLKGIIN